jgi:S-adenosylmethionine hydrolase
VAEARSPVEQTCISLLTDYGYEAGFVGTLHAVAFRIAPGATVIDLDHAIPPGNVLLGALRLERLARYLPRGIHVGVVDPGVGGTRRPVAIEAGGQVFVGPDNGLLVWGAEACGRLEAAVVLDNEEFFLVDRAQTFDGRDVFVPVAANLALGRALSAVGSSIDPESLSRVERPFMLLRPDGSFAAEVIQVDGFGNVQLAADARTVTALGLRPGDRVVIENGTERADVTFGSTFSDVSPGASVLLVDSDGQLAVSVNRGRADALIPAVPGARLSVRRLR